MASRATVLKILEIVDEKGEEALRYLSMVRDKWVKYKSRYDKCSTCGSRIKWVSDFEYECENGHRSQVIGLESWEFGVPPWFMNLLHNRGLVQVLYRSRSSTNYGVPDEVVEAIGEVLSGSALAEAEEVEEARPVEVAEDIFSDIVGLEDVKEVLLQALKSEKPVHILLVGPPASAKTMILEAISRFFDIPIILAGTSTKAGLRDYIAENKPAILLIDELDKFENPLDLSVLLTWMEGQKLTVTMATKRVSVKCPSVCKVIAAANTVSRIPPELLSRFIVIELKPYTAEEVREICVNILTKREGVAKELAERIASSVIDKLKSRDPRDCIKIARIAKKAEDIDRIVDILSTRKPRTR